MTLPFPKPTVTEIMSWLLGAGQHSLHQFKSDHVVSSDSSLAKPTFASSSHFPLPISMTHGIGWHLKTLRHSKGLLSWQPRLQLASHCLLPSPCPPFCQTHCADQRSGDKGFRDSNVYSVIQIPISKALVKVLCTLK